MAEIYLDNSATTPLYEEVIKIMNKVGREVYGNPSSRHLKGIEAEKIISEAKNVIAFSLGCSDAEIVFTSGGTEANNLAVRGVAIRNRQRGNHLITTPVEHYSVLNSYRSLEKEGFNVSFVNVDNEGNIDKDHLKNLMTAETILISIIHVNNETGCIQDISDLGKIIKNKNSRTLFHVDGVQSFGKINLKPLEKNIDLLSLSAHKIHGPKGVGALWIKKGTMLDPLFQGGDQEKGLRPGTENTVGIAGFGKAVSLAFKDKNRINDIAGFKKLFFKKLAKSLQVELNGPPLAEGAPNIVNISFPGIKGEVLANALEKEGLYASPGSACHAKRPEPSHVLKAMGLEKTIIESALRFSFSYLNNAAEVEEATNIIIQCVNSLREFVV